MKFFKNWMIAGLFQCFLTRAPRYTCFKIYIFILGSQLSHRKEQPFPIEQERYKFLPVKNEKKTENYSTMLKNVHKRAFLDRNKDSFPTHQFLKLQTTISLYKGWKADYAVQHTQHSQYYQPGGLHNYLPARA